MEPKEKKPDNEIGSTVEIRFTNIPGSVTLKGKVDTGADISSLHATEYQINDGRVTFICPELSSNRITVPLLTQQTVKSSDGGQEYRPVIALNIKINGILLTNIEFNLNDRGNMKFPVLIGKNLLIKGKFKIDPRLDESESHPSSLFSAPTGIKPEDFPGVIHIYKMEGVTTDEQINAVFTQRFAHVHLGSETYLIRYLSFGGKKLNPTTDGDEILYLMDVIENQLEDGDKEKLQDMLPTTNDEENNGNS